MTLTKRKPNTTNSSLKTNAALYEGSKPPSINTESPNQTQTTSPRGFPPFRPLAETPIHLCSDPIRLWSAHLLTQQWGFSRLMTINRALRGKSWPRKSDKKTCRGLILRVWGSLKLGRFERMWSHAGWDCSKIKRTDRTGRILISELCWISSFGDDSSCFYSAYWWMQHTSTTYWLYKSNSL